eukprot:5352155-Prymnesium_polylepis.2
MNRGEKGHASSRGGGGSRSSSRSGALEAERVPQLGRVVEGVEQERARGDQVSKVLRRTFGWRDSETVSVGGCAGRTRVGAQGGVRRAERAGGRAQPGGRDTCRAHLGSAVSSRRGERRTRPTRWPSSAFDPASS